MRLIAAVVAFLVLAGAAEARTRVVVNKPSAPQWHPVAFQAMLEINLCHHVAWSVPPEIPPGHPRLGKCPHRSFWQAAQPKAW